MKITSAFAVMAAFATMASAVPMERASSKAFAGSNLYYAAGLSPADRSTLFNGMKDAGMKVLRVWVDGESTASSKGTKITSYPSLEQNAVGTYDDTVLKLLDQVMLDAHDHGIKLLISMHSFNALNGGDVYSKKFTKSGFYTSADAAKAFDARLSHILSHEHSTLKKPWKELKEYIFAFEAENEAMIGLGDSFIDAHTNWQCDRATHIKSELGDNSGIMVTTGGESWAAESVKDAWLKCPGLDMISLHAYGPGDFATSALKPYVQKAQAAGKKLIMEEWGACYFNTENNNCLKGGVLDSNTRNANIKKWAEGITAAGLPWLYWQVLPNADPHYAGDYEVGVQDKAWPALKAAAQAAAQAPGAFDFSEYLL